MKVSDLVTVTFKDREANTVEQHSHISEEELWQLCVDKGLRPEVLLDSIAQLDDPETDTIEIDLVYARLSYPA